MNKAVVLLMFTSSFLNAMDSNTETPLPQGYNHAQRAAEANLRVAVARARRAGNPAASGAVPAADADLYRTLGATVTCPPALWPFVFNGNPVMLSRPPTQCTFTYPVEK